MFHIGPSRLAARFESGVETISWLESSTFHPQKWELFISFWTYRLILYDSLCAVYFTLQKTSYIVHSVKSVSIWRSFLVRIFQHFDWIRRNTKYLSIFSFKWGKIWTRKTPNTDTFPAVVTLVSFLPIFSAKTPWDHRKK